MYRPLVENGKSREGAPLHTRMKDMVTIARTDIIVSLWQGQRSSAPTTTSISFRGCPQNYTI